MSQKRPSTEHSNDTSEFHRAQSSEARKAKTLAELLIQISGFTGIALRRLRNLEWGFSLRFRLALALEIELHGSADEIFQSRLIDLVTFVDVDGAPDIPFKTRVE